MKALTLVLSSTLLLTGCANAYTNQTRTSLNNGAQRELAAWDTTQKQYDFQCPHSLPNKPLPREKAVESSQCYEDLARKNVMPVALDVTEVNKLLIAHKKAAIDYKKGAIDIDESRLRVQENWVNYVSVLDAKGNAALNVAAQQDAILAAQRQQYFQGLAQQQIQQQNASANSLKASAPTTTDCRSVGNHLKCTTW